MDPFDRLRDDLTSFGVTPYEVRLALYNGVADKLVVEIFKAAYSLDRGISAKEAHITRARRWDEGLHEAGLRDVIAIALRKIGVTNTGILQLMTPDELSLTPQLGSTRLAEVNRFLTENRLRLYRPDTSFLSHVRFIYGTPELVPVEYLWFRKIVPSKDLQTWRMLGIERLGKFSKIKRSRLQTLAHGNNSLFRLVTDMQLRRIALSLLELELGFAPEQ